MGGEGDEEQDLQALAEDGKWKDVLGAVAAVRGKRAKAAAATSVLAEAVEQGATKAVVALLAAGAEPEDATNGEGHTALFIAADNWHVAIVKLLLAAGASAEPEQNFAGGHEQTPLHVAANGGFLQICKLLVAAGADVNRGDWADEPVLQNLLYAKKPDVPTIKWLVSAGADLSTCPPDHSIDQPRPALVALLEAGTAYRPAFVPKIAELAALFLEAGADPNQCDPEGTTPLHIAVLREDRALATLLLSYGADPTREAEGDSPLSIAEGAMKALLSRPPAKAKAKRLKASRAAEPDGKPVKPT